MCIRDRNRIRQKYLLCKWQYGTLWRKCKTFSWTRRSGRSFQLQFRRLKLTDNVMIQMKSIQSIYDEKTETELITQGKFSKKNNSYPVSYTHLELPVPDCLILPNNLSVGFFSDASHIKINILLISNPEKWHLMQLFWIL